MSITESIYLRLPVPFKQAALNVYSRRLVQRRFASAAQDEQQWGIAVLQGKSWPEVRALQEARLIRLLQQAREHSPFWADRLARADGGGERVLESLAPFTKQQLRAAGRRLVCRNVAPRDLVAEQTSGSTGSPTRYYLSTEAMRRNFAFYRSFRAWHGYRPGQRRARFGGRLILPYAHRRPPYWLYDPAQQTIYLSLLHMSEATMAQYARAIASYGVAELSGYPSSLALFADWCRRSGETRLRPERVLTDAETLLSGQRELIEGTFGCPVIDSYGVSEMGTIAGECAHGTMHVFPHLVLLEVLDERGRRCREGEVGVIHLTSFANDAAPLIRYNTGDLGALGPIGCRCGLQTPTLAALEGRVDDVVTTADGRRIGRLDHIFKRSLEIRECQIVQQSPGRFLLRLVPGDGYEPSTLERTRAAVRSRLGAAAEVSFQIMDQIPRGPNGKFRAVVVEKEGTA